MSGRGPLRLRAAAALAGLLVLGGLAGLRHRAAAQAAAAATAPWRLERPTEARQTGTFQDPKLDESSGVAVSRRSPGLLWTHNDSGDGPNLYATDTLGRALGALTVTGARNEDWEAIALAPPYLYLADTGDNGSTRDAVTIYRVAEPADPRTSGGGAGATGHVTARATALTVRYPDGAHDVEALVVTPAGDLLLLAKTFKNAPTYYRVRARAWRSPGPVIADSLGTLPIDPGAVGRWITDAALAPDGRHVVVRTYRDLFLFVLTPDGHLAQADPPVQCDVTGLGPQGEGVAWLDGHTLVLTSEHALGLPATIHVVRCPALRADAPR